MRLLSLHLQEAKDDVVEVKKKKKIAPRKSQSPD